MPELPKALTETPRALPPGAPSIGMPMLFAGFLGAASAVALALAAPAIPDAYRRGQPGPFGLAAGAAIALIVAGILILWAVRARSLLRNGTPLAGRVLWSRRREAGTLHVRYAFRVPGGVEVERDYFLGDGGVARVGIAPAGGDVVWLVTDPHRPKRFALWGFSRGDARVRPGSAAGVPVVQ